MGAFEQKTATSKNLPADVPEAASAAAEHPDGAIYKANDGVRYRLRHARWVSVQARKKKDKSTATATKK
jgi:hypothetical protein